MTRMSDGAEKRRERVETALGALGTMRIEIRLARVRVEQAIDRWPATRYLLGPIGVYLVRWETHISRTMDLFRDLWLAGNSNGWNEEERKEFLDLLSDDWKET